MKLPKKVITHSLAVIAGISLATIPNGGTHVVPEKAANRDTVLVRINEERIKAGIPELVYDSSLQDFTDLRLSQVRESKDCSHDGYLDSDIESIGRDTSENLACGIYTAEDTVGGWLASPTHKAAMLDPKYHDVTISSDKGVTVALFSSAP